MTRITDAIDIGSIPTLASVLAAGQDPRDHLTRWDNLVDAVDNMLVVDNDREHAAQFARWIAREEAAGQPTQWMTEPTSYADRVDFVTLQLWQVEVLEGTVAVEDFAPYLPAHVAAAAANPMVLKLRDVCLGLDQALETIKDAVEQATRARQDVLDLLDMLAPGERARRNEGTEVED